MESSGGTSYGGTATGSETPNLDQMKGQASEKVGQAMDKAKTQVKSALSEQKEKATGTLGSLAGALRTTGDQLRQQGQTPMADWATSAAGAVERFSGMLQERDIDQIASEAQNLARRYPALFLGGAFMLGFAAARFLKSSRAYGERGGEGRGYEGAYGGSYQGAYGGSYGSDTFAAASQPATGTGMATGAGMAGAQAAMGGVEDLSASETLVGSNAPQPSMGIQDRQTTGTDATLTEETEEAPTLGSAPGARTGDVI